jgi:DNA-binding transcriptional MocR family regulator
MPDRRSGSGQEPGPHGRFVVTDASRPLKRTVGPTAWAVLEDVVLDVVPEEGRYVARTSVRVIADHLGVTPGTVARALARLCNEGLVHREDRRDGATGRFGESVYVVDPRPALRPCVDSPHTAGRDTVHPDMGKPTVEYRDMEPRPVAVTKAGGSRRGGAAEPAQLPLLTSDSDVVVQTRPIAATPRPTNHSVANAEPPAAHLPSAQAPSAGEALRPIAHRLPDTCQPFGQALPGRASC